MPEQRIAALETAVKNLDRKIDAVHADIKEDVGEIAVQTRKTNGRVTETERQLIEMNARQDERSKAGLELAQVKADYETAIKQQTERRSDRWFTVALKIGGGLILLLAGVGIAQIPT